MNKITKREQRKKEIIDMILPLFDENGIEDLSIKDICAATNLSVGSFYHYFENKEAIYGELFKQLDRYILEHQASIQASDDEVTNLISFANHYIYHVIKWGYYCNLAIVLYSLQPQNYHYSQKQRPFYKVLHEIATNAYDKGQLKDGLTAELVEEMVLVLIRSYSFEWAKQPNETPFEFNTEVPLSLFESSIRK